MNLKESTRDIFQKKVSVGDVDIYPVTMGEYDEFMECANVISYTYGHFNLDAISKDHGVPKEEIKLLDLITFLSYQGNAQQLTFLYLSKMFSIALRQEIKFSYDQETGLFFMSSDNKKLIDRNNYDDIRKVIMEQNLIFEPKIYKSKMVQKWAEKVLKNRAKSALDITHEDMITTISVIQGITYEELERYSIFQIKATFQRICKIQEYQTTAIMLANPYAAGAVKLGHFAENTDIRRDPSSDIFKDSSKLGKLNDAIGN